MSYSYLTFYFIRWMVNLQQNPCLIKVSRMWDPLLRPPFWVSTKWGRVETCSVCTWSDLNSSRLEISGFSPTGRISYPNPYKSYQSQPKEQASKGCGPNYAQRHPCLEPGAQIFMYVTNKSSCGLEVILVDELNKSYSNLKIGPHIATYLGLL